MKRCCAVMTAAVLVAAAGAAPAVLTAPASAQVRQDERTQEDNRRREFDPTRRSNRDRGSLRLPQRNNQPMTDEARIAQEAALAGEDRSLVGQEGELEINTTNPIGLQQFIEYVSNATQTPIITDNIPQTDITFYAPVSIGVDQLIPLLRSLLEDYSLTLTYDDELDIYRVRQAGNIEVKFGPEGDGFATTRLFPTPLLKPSALQQAIQTQLGGGPQGGGTGARFTTLDELGLMIVTASPRTLDVIEELIARITEGVAGQSFRSFDLQNVSAVYARQRVLSLAGETAQAGGAGIRSGQGQAPAAAAAGALSNLDQRLFLEQGNRLLFRGTPEEHEALATLIEAVDQTSSLIVRRYIAGSVAAQVAEAGQQLGLGPVSELSVGTRSTGGGFGGRTGGANQRGFGQPQEEATPAASQFILDLETGSFIYYGTESQHDRVDMLVEDFKDTNVGDDIEIRTYKLLYAPVEAGEDDEGEGVAAILERLIEDPRDNVARGRFLPGTRAGTTGFDPSLIPEPETDLDVDVDVDAGAEAGAEAAQPTGGVASVGGEGTRLIATSQNTTIVADVARNQIIIKAPARAQEQFARLIEQLDQRQPQVMVAVDIVSVTSNDEFDFAADVQINAGDFFLFNTFGLTAAGATALDPRTANTGNTGLTTGIIQSDYLPVVINALESVGTTRTVSNPKVLVNDNSPAIFESTNEVPFATTSQGANTTITGQGGVAEAGTVLDVRPRISEGGDISLQVTLELSSFTGEGQSGLQPPRQTSNYESVVTVPSDSTIIIGGFTLNQSSDEERKLPILGDIPILGLLFKDIAQSSTRNTVFIFITPRIYNDPRGDDLRIVTEGALAAAGLDDGRPKMELVTIPIVGRLGPDRVLPRNEIAEEAELSSIPGDPSTW